MLTLLLCFCFLQGDPGEDGAPGKPGTAVVRSHSLTCCDSAVTWKHLPKTVFISGDFSLFSFSNQDVQKALASLGIQVCEF